MESLKRKLEDVQLELLHTQMELSEVKSKYDSLCSKMKRNANDKRNEGDHFLSSYGKDRKGPWN